MSGTELILTVLATGATAVTAAVVSASVTAAVTDTYERAKHLIGRKLAEQRHRRVRGAAARNDAIDTGDYDRSQHGGGASPALSRLEHEMRTRVPHQLPPAVPIFVGREHETAMLADLLNDTSPGSTLVISAIEGTAGIGKTALAVWSAHQLTGAFPDGQLYVNLRGFGPGAEAPLDPSAAILGFLEGLGIPLEHLPAEPDAQAALYRSLVADKRMLIVLDNARDAAQVRPLLPAARRSAVIVTSRNQLESLVALEGAHLLCLDLLTEEDAWDLLAARAGAGRLAAEPDAASEIIAASARLPLALAIIGARAAAKPRFPLQAIAIELRESRDRVATLSGGDAATDLRAVFSWSYQALSTEAARMFRVLGLHPSAEISIATASSLADLPQERSRELVDELERANLLTQYAPGRYSLHDLLRGYAAHLVNRLDPANSRRAATHRLLDHYLLTGETAALLLRPAREAFLLALPRTTDTPAPLASYEQAMDWFLTEHAHLLAAIERADAAGIDSLALQLAGLLTTFLDHRERWRDHTVTQFATQAAQRRLNYIPAQPLVGRRADTPQTSAPERDRRAPAVHDLNVPAAADARIGQAHLQYMLAYLWDRPGSHAKAFRHAQRALSLYKAAGHKLAQARLLNGCGWHLAHLGKLDQARTACESALSLQQQLSDHAGAASTWDSLGLIHHRRGDLLQALTSYQRALHLYRELDAHYEQAATLIRLGGLHRANGDRPSGQTAWHEALSILVDLDHPDSERLHKQLAAASAEST